MSVVTVNVEHLASQKLLVSWTADAPTLPRKGDVVTIDGCNYEVQYLRHFIDPSRPTYIYVLVDDLSAAGRPT